MIIIKMFVVVGVVVDALSCYIYSLKLSRMRCDARRGCTKLVPAAARQPPRIHPTNGWLGMAVDAASHVCSLAPPIIHIYVYICIHLFVP